MWATKFKLEKPIQFVIYGYVLLFASRVLQSYSDSIDERAVSYWDTIIALFFEICWAFMYFFVSQMVIVKTLLMDSAAISSDKSDSNIMKSSQSKGEQIRNQMRTRNQILIFLVSSSVCQVILKLISASTNSQQFVLESIFAFINFLVDVYVLYLFNSLCFSFAETRHANGLKPHKMFPVQLMMNISVGLIFYRHLSHLILSIMKAVPSVLTLFRTNALIVIQSYFADPMIDIVPAIMMLWFFYKCGKFSILSGLEKLIADSSEAKQFYDNNHTLLTNSSFNNRSSLPLNQVGPSKKIDERENLAFSDDEEEDNKVGSQMKKNLNFTNEDTNESVDDHNNSGYIKKTV